MRLPLLPAAVLAAAVLIGPAAAQSPLVPAPMPPASLTPGQRQEVVGILRDALRQDPSILREALAALQADEARREDGVQREALALLAGKLVDPADPVAGNPLAKVTLVEFFDTRCPYCRRLLATTDELLRTDPDVRIVFKDLPVLGPSSQMESRALLAAQRQGGYFPMQQALMHGGGVPTRDTLRAEAERQGLDGGRLLRDLDDPAIKARLDANVALAQQIGLQSTPALVIGTRLVQGAVEIGGFAGHGGAGSGGGITGRASRFTAFYSSVATAVVAASLQGELDELKHGKLVFRGLTYAV